MDKTKSTNDLILYRLDEIKEELVDIKHRYVTKAESKALKVEIQALKEKVISLEKTTTHEIERLKASKQLKNTVVWVVLATSAVINVVLAYTTLTEK
jgi:hypothetical protein